MEPWNRHPFEYPSRIPTMITQEECRYLHWLASSHWRGEGHVVEIGPWLGGSTISLAMGMIENPRRDGWKLHVYDNFVWREFMAARYPLPIQPGDSFEPFFIDNLAAYLESIHVHRAWLPDEEVASDSFASCSREVDGGDTEPVTWDSGQPVEILFVDGAKSWSGLRYLLTTFTGALDRGSLLVFQDLKFWGAYWVAVMTEFLRDHLTLVHNLPRNTVAFTLKKPLTTADMEHLPAWGDLDPWDCEAKLEGAAQRLEDLGDRSGGAIVRLGKVRMWVHKGSVDSAADSFRRSEVTWPFSSDDGNLKAVRRWLAQETGRRFPVAGRTRLRRLMWPVVRRLR